jgi:DUF971 family protein
MDASPELLEVKRLEAGGLMVSWSDGSKMELSSLMLRKNCPCAVCAEERGEGGHRKPLGSPRGLLRVVEHSAEEELRLKKITAVGNYAVRLHWADGHDTGIYTFALLRRLSS